MTDPASLLPAGFTLQRESFTAIWPEMKPLAEAHWREIAHYQDIPLDPDHQVYDAATASGNVVFFTVRDEDGRMVGYAGYFVRANIHYRGSKQAVQDVLFLLTEYRRSRIGMALIAYCDDQLRADGVQVVYQHVKVAHNFGPLLERIGYEHVEHIYARRLDQ